MGTLKRLINKGFLGFERWFFGARRVFQPVIRDLQGARTLSIKYRQPYGGDRRVGLLDPVAAMWRDFHPIAGPENPGFGLVGEAQPRAAGEHDHPFRFRLVVPKPGWARLTS